MLQGSTVAQLAEKIARYREARQQAGWEPQGGKVTLMLHTFVHPDADYARRLVREPFLEYIRSSLDEHKTAFNGGDQQFGRPPKMASYLTSAIVARLVDRQSGQLFLDIKSAAISE
jgi:alkanesulfonate monooxygenase SsuD/methylene tetrahydromethanopterin reductase-like flavin-dependent oxidoreductase (luciferase family)